MGDNVDPYVTRAAWLDAWSKIADLTRERDQLRQRLAGHQSLNAAHVGRLKEKDAELDQLRAELERTQAKRHPIPSPELYQRYEQVMGENSTLRAELETLKQYLLAERDRLPELAQLKAERDDLQRRLGEATAQLARVTEHERLQYRELERLRIERASLDRSAELDRLSIVADEELEAARLALIDWRALAVDLAGLVERISTAYDGEWNADLAEEVAMTLVEVRPIKDMNDSDWSDEDSDDLDDDSERTNDDEQEQE